MTLLISLKNFLKSNFDSKRPVLFAFSGGIDSSALLDVLLKLKDQFKIDLHIAHIDHGWRKESQIEANLIRQKMEHLNIPFHFKKLQMTSKKNLENESREHRLSFFQELFQQYDFQALILAHQKNDLAETVLKRFLEGANIFSLTAMKKISKYENMTVWRPFLEIERKDIISYLKKNTLKYFIDATNDDTKFLRAKMRKDIFPFLQKNFNKQVMDNIIFLSESSLEMDGYLQRKTKDYLKKIKRSAFGLMLDLSDIKEPLEVKYVVKKIAKAQKMIISRPVLDQITFWLMNKKTNLRLKLKNGNIFVDRGHFFIFNRLRPKLFEKVVLKEGTIEFDDWLIKVEKAKSSNRDKISWKNLFSNNLKIYIPEGKYFVSYPFSNRKLKKLWENTKVPGFLRPLVPIIYNDAGIYEFLSGKKVENKNSHIWQISIELK